CSLSSLPFCFSTTTATPAIYTLSLHDALPISFRFFFFLKKQMVFTDSPAQKRPQCQTIFNALQVGLQEPQQDTVHLLQLFKNLKDRKSTRLNSSHVKISYAVFCLKKKKK